MEGRNEPENEGSGETVSCPRFSASPRLRFENIKN